MIRFRLLRGRRRSQSGQFLEGMGLALILLLIVLGVLFKSWQYSQAQEAAKGQGNILAQFATGVRGFVTAVQGGSVTLPSNPYTVTGVTWLMPPSCGGPASNPVAGYIPCGFPNGFTQQAYSTTISLNTSTNAILAQTTYFVHAMPGFTAASSRAFAADVASAAMATQDQSPTGQFYNVFDNTPLGATAQTDPSAQVAADYGRVTLSINNAPSNNIFLRVDGTNQMLANLNVGGNSIVNADNGSFSGSAHVAGTVQIDNGLSVTAGTADLRGGVITPDTALTDIGWYASQGVYDVQILTGSTSYNVPKPNCTLAANGTSSPAIYVAMQGTGSPEGTADAIYSAYSSVVDNGTYWTITPIVEGTYFSLTGSSTSTTLTVNLNKTLVTVNGAKDQTIMVMTKCR